MAITKRNSKMFALVTHTDGTTVKERAKDYEDFEWSAGAEGVAKFTAKHPGAIFGVFVRIPA